MTKLMQRYVPQIEHAMARALDGASSLRMILRYHVGLSDEHGCPTHDGGKLLRPSLLLFVGEELGVSVGSAMPAAVGLEMMHAFSLLHDDIQDADRTRRGRAAAWTLWGIPQAINAGDLMHALAAREALRSGQQAAERLLDATAAMIEGQSEDLSFESQRIALQAYLEMIDKKTGALITAALEIAGLIADAAPNVLSALGRLGHAMGRAFQIQDDLLGIWGDADALGKPSGSDIRRRKKAYPAVLAFERATGRDLEYLQDAYMQETPIEEDQVDQVVKLMTRLEVRQSGRDHVHAAVTRAIDALDRLPFSREGRAEMQALLEYLERRER
jgi:geranylgeranyl diphosphate synthase, type I